jgi:hypothetical protein
MELAQEFIIAGKPRPSRIVQHISLARRTRLVEMLINTSP